MKNKNKTNAIDLRKQKTNLKKKVSYVINLLVLNYLIWAFLFIPTSTAYFQSKVIEPLQPKTITVEKEVKVEVVREMNIEEKIVYYANIYGVDTDTAIRIAKCESKLNPKAENVNGSATGVYQFIRKTWKTYCEGDVYDEDANIICFMQNYNDHPGWWECK
jgi:hypothetical protein